MQHVMCWALRGEQLKGNHVMNRGLDNWGGKKQKTNLYTVKTKGTGIRITLVLVDHTAVEKKKPISNKSDFYCN